MRSRNNGLTTSYVECLQMLELIITSISINEHFSAWERVVGSDCDKPIAAGYTKIDAYGTKAKAQSKHSNKQNATPFRGKITEDHISFEEAKHKAHDAQKLLFFSRLQLSLINVSRHVSAILWGDYGTGKVTIHHKRFLERSQFAVLLF